jgi:hypothetical protein
MYGRYGGPVSLRGSDVMLEYLLVLALESYLVNPPEGQDCTGHAIRPGETLMRSDDGSCWTFVPLPGGGPTPTPLVLPPTPTPLVLPATPTPATGGSLPSGMIALFNAACPLGWSEVTALRGRVAVGVPLGGTLAGTVGTALTDLQDPTHTHTYTQVPNHVHVQSLPTGQTGAQNSGTRDTSTTGSGADALSTANPTGGVATGTTNATSATMPYVQLRYCSKD